MSTCLPNSTLPCWVLFFCCRFLPLPAHPPFPDLKPLFHANLHIVLLSKHFLFNSHFAIQTILGIIALRNKENPWWSKSLVQVMNFSRLSFKLETWTGIRCYRKKQTNIQTKTPNTKPRKRNLRNTRICNYRTKYLRLESKVRRWQSKKTSAIHNCKPKRLAPQCNRTSVH